MRIALVNGSTKPTGSASGILLKHLRASLSGQAELVDLALHSDSLPDGAWNTLQAADSYVFACPLYVDGLPSHVLSCLVQLEERQTSGVPVYGIVNCGFYEGEQARYALDILKNWCVRAGCRWSGGIGVGGGGSLAALAEIPPEHGPMAPVGRALHAAASHILRQEAFENQYLSVGMPRLMYRMAAQLGWRKQLLANGGKRCDLGKKWEQNRL